MTLGPDEWVYTQHALSVEVHGRYGFEAEAMHYLNNPAARDYPSPIRWGWALCLRVTHRVAAVFALACVAMLPGAASSPLLWHLARRRLQDTAVAAATVAAVLSAQHGNVYTLAGAAFVLAALKSEGLALALPAVILAGGRAVLAPLAVAGLAWALVTAWLFGAVRAWRLAGAVFQPHDNAYSREHQKGMPHRLAVDLALVSPVWLGAALWYHPAALAPAASLLVAHALSPVRNVRTVLAADLLMRAAVVTAAPWWVIAEAAVLDLWVWLRIRRAGLYDTPTAELVRAVCK